MKMTKMRVEALFMYPHLALLQIYATSPWSLNVKPIAVMRCALVPLIPKELVAAGSEA